MKLRTTRLGAAVLLLLGLMITSVSLPARAAPATQAFGPEEGLVCTEPNLNGEFRMTAIDGYIGLPDGNTIYMWGYATEGGFFQYPGPVLCANEGDTVTVVLENQLTYPTSLMFPGQENVLADGVPAQPEFDIDGTVTSLTTSVAPGGTLTYSFVAGQPGTFVYTSGTDASVQSQMGLSGVLVVRPSLGANYAYNSVHTEFNPAHEYLAVFSEIDPLMHSAMERSVQRGQAFTYDMSQYIARYWLLNGRGFPDTMAPNFAPWLPDQPYGALVRIEPYDASTNPLPALIRYVSVTSGIVPFHPHGNHSDVIARDGQLLESDTGEDLSFEKFSLPVAAGQTWDVMFIWEDPDRYDPVTNPIPVELPNQLDTFYGQYFSGNPYLGTVGSLPVGSENYNQCGEYYHVAHNHALHALTAWGLVMSGQITFTRIDPPGGCPVGP
jgi:FtsP/CotA-like multicopper oxidase with cupredoxin domain